MTMSRSDLDVAIGLDPQRVEVGETAHGRVTVANPGRQRPGRVAFEVPVDPGAPVRVEAPRLGPGDRWEDGAFELKTERRSVMTVGPVSSVRGDPLGLAR